MFFDPFVCYLDDEVINGELRETIIGLTTTWLLLCVVYVMRDDIIRIVSARLVTKAERETYENQLTFPTAEKRSPNDNGQSAYSGGCVG